MKNLIPLLFLCLAAALVGCGKGGGTANTLEVQAFKGGYDIDFYAQAGKEFAAKNPGWTVDVEGDPRVWEKLRPRLVANNPPDLMFPGWDLDHFAAQAEGQLLNLDDAMASPAYDGKGKWGDTFDPSLLEIAKIDGKQFTLPYYFNVWGVWYDPGVFAKNGWTPPKTYDELLALCEKIKAKGIAPITFQGKYPYYMLEGLMLPWIQDIGGLKAIQDMQNLVPGAWKSPAVLKSAQMIKELLAKGYFETGAVGLSHTESQTDFLNGKAAMIPCGTWLDSEMKKTMPPGVSIKYMVTPVAAGSGDPTAVPIDIEPWMVPSKGKHPDQAIAYFKYMTSLDVAKRFVTEKAGLMSIKGSDEVKLPATLVEPAAAFRASKTKWCFQMRYWYKPMEKEVEDAVTELLGAGTPEGFCARCEAAAEKTRNDASVRKFKVGG